MCAAGLGAEPTTAEVNMARKPDTHHTAPRSPSGSGYFRMRLLPYKVGKFFATVIIIGAIFNFVASAYGAVLAVEFLIGYFFVEESLTRNRSSDKSTFSAPVLDRADSANDRQRQEIGRK